MEEKVLSSRRLYDGRVVGLRVDTVRTPTGRLTEREVVEHRGSVAIVALDEHRNVLLVRQYREAVGDVLLELPAGTREAGEDIEVCVRRELQEETGYSAGRIEPLVTFYTSPGFCTEEMAIYLATELVPATLASAEDESLQLVKVPLEEAWQMVENGQIHDGKSIIGLLYLKSIYNFQPPGSAR